MRSLLRRTEKRPPVELEFGLEKKRHVEQKKRVFLSSYSNISYSEVVQRVDS